MGQTRLGAVRAGTQEGLAADSCPVTQACAFIWAGISD
jgi:hypothetical protein